MSREFDSSNTEHTHKRTNFTSLYLLTAAIIEYVMVCVMVVIAKNIDYVCVRSVMFELTTNQQKKNEYIQFVSVVCNE